MKGVIIVEDKTIINMSQRIYMKRTEKNMTMAELASHLGVQASAVNKWEKGTVQNIKQSTIKKMADVFDCSPAWLMGYDDTPLSFDFTPEQEEQELLALWRNAPENIKDSVMILLKSVL